MKLGYMGKILLVDLTAREIREEIIPDDVYEQYLSGIGLAAYMLYGRIPAGADPLGPENILGFVSGLLTGTGSLFAGRWMVVGKSPLTGGWGEANCATTAMYAGECAPLFSRIQGVEDSSVMPRSCKGLKIWQKSYQLSLDIYR